MNPDPLHVEGDEPDIEYLTTRQKVRDMFLAIGALIAVLGLVAWAMRVP